MSKKPNSQDGISLALMSQYVESNQKKLSGTKLSFSEKCRMVDPDFNREEHSSEDSSEFWFEEINGNRCLIIKSSL